MRNLKRALSLVMAMALIVGMMVVSASAASKDFTDADEIRHPEAVNTMVALNVISGKEDGSYFDPTGTLTRAEMAKIISYVMNGGVEPNIGTKVVPTYSDIDNHWAEAYIEYCTSMGIINGDGAGKFNPGGTLTASQAAKMFLTAMGYNAEVFGLVGNDWETNTNRYANEAGLYENLGNVSVSAPISRDDACQMAYNAIQSPLMVRGWSQDMTTGNITERYELAVNDEGEATRSLFSERFDGKIFVGSFDGNSDTLSIKDGNVQITDALTTDDTAADGWKDKTATFPYDLDIAGIGEEFKVIYKEGTGGRDGRPDEKDTIYGVYNAGTTDVLNSTVDGIKGDLGSTGENAGKVQIDGVKYDVAAAAETTTVVVVENYGASTKTAGTADKAGTKAAIESLSAQKGDTVKFIMNEDGEIAKAYVVKSVLTHVTAVNSEKVSISGLGSITIADNELYEGIAKDDVVVATTLYNTSATADGAYTIVEKAETVSGTINGFKNAASKNETITLDGTVYKVYGKTDLDISLGSDVSGLTDVVDSDDIGETFTLYLVNGYVAAAAQTSESASNYSLVLDTDGTKGDTFSPLKLQVLAADGTKSIITVDKDSTATPNVGDIVTYTGSADNALVKVEEPRDDISTSTAKFYDKTSKTVEGTVTAADAVLFVNVGTEYKAYNIRSLGDIDTAGKACTIIEKDGKVIAASIDLGDTPSGATSTAIYGMVTADNGTVKVDDTPYTNYTLWTTDGEKKVNVKTGGTLTVGTIYKYEPTADETYASTDFKAHGGTAVAIKNYDEADGLLTYLTERSGTAPDATFAKTTTKAVSDEVTVLYVNCKDDVAGDEIGINTYDDITDLYNALIIVDSDEVITHIIIETSNEADIA